MRSFLFYIYILIERYLAVKYPVESNQLRTKKFQLIYLITVKVISSVYYTPALFSYNIQHKILDENSTIDACDFIQGRKLTIQILCSSPDIILSSILILVFSIILIYTIRKSNIRMSTFYTQRENEIFNKDVHLSILAIVMNFLSLAASLAIIINFYYISKFF